MTNEIFFVGQWVVTQRLGGVVLAVVFCDTYGDALRAFCELAGVL